MPDSRALRHDWTRQEVAALFALPFSDLLFQAQTQHRAFFNPNQVQVSTLCSIKTGPLGSLLSQCARLICFYITAYDG